MAETTADVRRDIELTRERMSDTIAELERRVNLVQVLRDHPWPALAITAGAGFLLARSRVDVKAAAATVAATGGASSKVGTVLDDFAARLIGGVTTAVNERVDGWVDELKAAVGAAPSRAAPPRPSRGAMAFGDAEVANSSRFGDGPSGSLGGNADELGIGRSAGTQ